MIVGKFNGMYIVASNELMMVHGKQLEDVQYWRRISRGDDNARWLTSGQDGFGNHTEWRVPIRYQEDDAVYWLNTVVPKCNIATDLEARMAYWWWCAETVARELKFYRDVHGISHMREMEMPSQFSAYYTRLLEDMYYAKLITYDKFKELSEISLVYTSLKKARAIEKTLKEIGSDEDKPASSDPTDEEFFEPWI